MALVQKELDEEKLVVEFNNGDLTALKAAADKWNFKDLSSALRFCVAVLTLAEDGKLFNGANILSPSDNLTKKSDT